MIKTCAQCHTEFETKDGRKKFCNQTCSARHQVGRRKKTIKRPKNPKTTDCLHCGVEIEYYGSTKRKYCNHGCKYGAQHDAYIVRWLAGEVSGHRKGPTAQISTHIRKWLFKQHNNSCQNCGWGEINPHTGRIPLHVHHVDGNWKNNRPENLELLCPNCHSLTDNFGSRNSGGRPR